MARIPANPADSSPFAAIMGDAADQLSPLNLVDQGILQLTTRLQNAYQPLQRFSSTIESIGAAIAPAITSIQGLTETITALTTAASVQPSTPGPAASATPSGTVAGGPSRDSQPQRPLRDNPDLDSVFGIRPRQTPVTPPASPSLRPPLPQIVTIERPGRQPAAQGQSQQGQREPFPSQRGAPPTPLPPHQAAPIPRNAPPDVPPSQRFPEPPAMPAINPSPFGTGRPVPAPTAAPNITLNAPRPEPARTFERPRPAPTAAPNITLNAPRPEPARTFERPRPAPAAPPIISIPPPIVFAPPPATRPPQREIDKRSMEPSERRQPLAPVPPAPAQPLAPVAPDSPTVVNITAAVVNLTGPLSGIPTPVAQTPQPQPTAATAEKPGPTPAPQLPTVDRPLRDNPDLDSVFGIPPRESRPPAGAPAQAAVPAIRLPLQVQPPAPPTVVSGPRPQQQSQREPEQAAKPVAIDASGVRNLSAQTGSLNDTAKQATEQVKALAESLAKVKAPAFRQPSPDAGRQTPTGFISGSHRPATPPPSAPTVPAMPRPTPAPTTFGFAGFPQRPGATDQAGFLGGVPKATVQVAKNAATSVKDHATGGLDRLEGATAKAQKPLLNLVDAFSKTAETALTPLTASLGLFAAATSGAISQIQSFVSKANPAAAMQFNRAVDDLAGTMGQILTPVLEGITVFVREFADVLQGMKPALDPIMKAISGIIKEMATLIQPIAELLMPVLELVGGIVRDVVVPVMHLLVEGLKDLAKIIKDVLSELGLSAELEKKSSQGAAVRPASYGKIEDIGRRTTLSALTVGRGNLSDDGKAITAKIDRTNTLLEKLMPTGIPKSDDSTLTQIRKVSNLVNPATQGLALAKELRRMLFD